MVVPGLRNENKGQENQTNGAYGPVDQAANGITRKEDYQLSEIQEKETINEADTVQNENLDEYDDAGSRIGANKHFQGSIVTTDEHE